uniref:Plexin-A2 n=1 Tax=Sipha flava TaxID=143950 RepID=A0A2S2QLK2_9HEMI
MFVNRNPKKFICLWNHLFTNQLWFAVAVVFAVTTCGGGETAATVDKGPNCAVKYTCLDCVKLAPKCMWLMATQTCNRTTATTDASTGSPPPLTAYGEESCPSFDVTFNKSRDDYGITHHHVKVLVSNDPMWAFRALLHRSVIKCYMNEVNVTGKEFDGRITCDLPENKVINPAMSKSPFSYVSVTMGGVTLAFNDRLDHYLDTHHFNGCVAQQEYNDECVSCSWDTEDGRRYYCRWCSGNDQCTGMSQNCDVRLLSNTTYSEDASNVEVRCPVARIESIVPAYASWAGGTTVRVTVSNHKILSENCLVVVTISTSKCLLPSTTKDGTGIMCTISPAGNGTRPADGPVRVTYVSRLDDRPERNQVTVRSEKPFRFVEPEITGMRPTCGPTTGGTRVTIKGNYLDAGSSVRVFIRENITCEVMVHKPNEVSCVTGASGVPLAGRVKLEFGSYLSKYVHHALFEYTGEPTVNGNQTFSGIASGGTSMVVRGRYFTCIENPLLYVIRHGIRYTGPCHVLNSTAMVCITPKLNRPAPHVVTEQLQYGFQADFSKTILPLRPPPGSPKYHLYPDPVYTDFQTDGGRTVTINGLHLDRGYNVQDDLSVRLQHTAVPCNVTYVGPHRIVCQTPLWSGGIGSTAGVVHDGIVVTLGNNMAYEVKRNPKRPIKAVHLTVIFSGVAIVLLVATITIAFVYCLKIAMKASHRQTEMQSLSEHCGYTGATFVTGAAAAAEAVADRADPDAVVTDKSHPDATVADKSLPDAAVADKTNTAAVDNGAQDEKE